MAVARLIPLSENVRLQRRDSAVLQRVPRNGVLTLFGFGILVRVDRGHLIVADGIGNVRRNFRLARVGHNLRRLIVIGAEGSISLAALRWLCDQDAAFVFLERDGTLLATSGRIRASDIRLRRAQALAHQTGAALEIFRELIRQKLFAQERVAGDSLRDSMAAQIINQCCAALGNAESIPAIRLIESQAGAAYWSAWHELSVTFPRAELPRVPDHWRVFGTRKSPLSGSPRAAANPFNAMLNYLYALLESEARLAATALGLDPGIGMLHADTPNRDSLACDIMEPLRAQVDSFLLGWVRSTPLRREWFFERRDGTCRLMGPFAAQLSETAPTWARAVAPWAEWVAQMLSKTAKPERAFGPATRLTQRRRREARGGHHFRALNPHRVRNLFAGFVARRSILAAGTVSFARLMYRRNNSRKLLASDVKLRKVSELKQDKPLSEV